MDNRNLRAGIKKALATAALAALGPELLPGAEGLVRGITFTPNAGGQKRRKVAAEIRAAAKLQHVRARASKRKAGGKGRWRRRKENQRLRFTRIGRNVAAAVVLGRFAAEVLPPVVLQNL